MYYKAVCQYTGNVQGGWNWKNPYNYFHGTEIKSEETKMRDHAGTKS